MTTKVKVTRRKLSLMELASKMSNVSKACSHVSSGGVRRMWLQHAPLTR